MDSVIIPYLCQDKKKIVTLYEDQASIHTAEQTKQLFEDNNIDHRDFPQYSPGMSSQEKVWANLGARLYADEREYKSKEELTLALNREWENLVGDASYRRRLVNQGEEACKKVIENQGYRVHWE